MPSFRRRVDVRIDCMSLNESNWPSLTTNTRLWNGWRAFVRQNSSPWMLPRLYRDGLTSAQSNEDCTFVLRARSRFTSGKWWHPFSSSHGETPTSKRTDFLEITFRARTTLERDVWVRVLSAEIEKVVRAHPQREDCLRHFGRIPS